MTRSSVEQLIWLLDQAFEADDEHSVVDNLKHVGDAWDVVPAGGERSIADIINHVGGCKYIYENHAFGDRASEWGQAPVQGPSDPAEAMDWMREGHRLLIESVRALDDAELAVPRLTNWGEPMETRKILEVLVAHDFYHAGEINHIRSILQRTDRWAHLGD